MQRQSNDMAKWTWEVLMRTETTLQTESMPLQFIPSFGNSREATSAHLLIMEWRLAAVTHCLTNRLWESPVLCCYAEA